MIVASCFVVTGVMTKVNTDGFQDGFLGLTLVTVVLISSFSGICQVQIETCLIIHHRLIIMNLSNFPIILENSIKRQLRVFRKNYK